MKSFLSLSAEDRNVYFQEAATKSGMFSATIYEKDFWVCWTLKKLFELPDVGRHLTFKGGTSLSKVYKIIHRFSEDIDVSIHRSFFGFNGEQDPENASGSNVRSRRLVALSDACTKLIKSELLPMLETAFRAEIVGTWRIAVDEKDPQTLLFEL